MKMELIEGSETSAISTVTPGNYPKENTHIYIYILDFKLSPCSVCNMFFWVIPGVTVLIADVSEPSINSIFIGRWMKYHPYVFFGHM